MGACLVEPLLHETQHLAAWDVTTRCGYSRFKKISTGNGMAESSF
jgi:hypothetical protein